jgi:glutamate synthase domain-containing protein 2
VVGDQAAGAAIRLAQLVKHGLFGHISQKQIEALIAGVRKVSARLEASKPAPQVANNP